MAELRGIISIFSDCGVKGTAIPLQRNLKIKS